MRVRWILWFLLHLSACYAQNTTVRYEPLKNKDNAADNRAWAKGSDYYVRSYGLSFEWLEVTTKDNVKLKVHRLWNPRVNGTRIPVLMLPAVLSDGDIFLMNRPEGNFAMLLANQGYEVFLANYRNSFHSEMTPEQYLSTSIDANAFLDVIPIFDLVLEVTKQPQLHLLGYSKGSTIAMELLADRVEYNEKVRLLILISPVSYIETPNPLLGFGMNLLKALTYIGGTTFARIFDSNFFFDFLRYYPAPQLLQGLENAVPILGKCFLNLIWTGKLDCFSELNFDTDLVEKIFTRAIPQLVLTRELGQFAQNSKGKALQSYSPAWLDRDLKAMLFDVYPGTKKYNLKNVTCPVIILQASVELFSQPQDYKRIRNELCSRILEGKLSPNKYVFQVGIPNYQHVDPFVGRNNNHIYTTAFYMIMREFDISRDSSLQSVLGYIEPDFSNLVPQTCEG